MLIKKIKFVDFNGVEREKEAYFNLNKAEVVKWLLTEGDYTMDKVLEKLQKESNRKKVVEIFDDLIKRSYGVLSLDGISFVKREEDYEMFKGSGAYDALFTELISDAKVAAEFFNAVIPKDLADEITRIVSGNPEGIPAELRDYIS